MQRMHIRAMRSSPMELVGVHPTCLLTKTQSSFEEAHHWNIQAKFFSVGVPTQLCMNDNLYGVQIYYGVRVWIFQKEQQCCPLLSFYFFFLSFFYFFVFLQTLWLFLFISHLSSLGSFHVSSFGIFYFVLFGIFSSLLRATLYILQESRRSSHFTRSTQHKEN